MRLNSEREHISNRRPFTEEHVGKLNPANASGIKVINILQQVVNKSEGYHRRPPPLSEFVNIAEIYDQARDASFK